MHFQGFTQATFPWDKMGHISLPGGVYPIHM